MPDTIKTVFDQEPAKALKELKRALKAWPLDVIVRKEKVLFATGHKAFILYVVGERPPLAEMENLLPLDYLVRMPEKVAAFVLGKLDLNKRIFARKCEVIQVKKSVAKD